MNKQELIDEYTAEISRLRPYCPNRHLISEQLKYDLYKEILDDLKQLDEPQKLILPKCAEQWIEGHCAPSDVVNLFIEVTCATDSDGFIDSKWRWSTDFYEWLANDADTLYILCDALRYGYEVEESKWVVNEGDLVIRKGEHEAKVYFVESVDDDGILLVNGIKDEFFTDLDDRSVDEESINYFYENFRLLAKKENLEAEKV